ncbi:unnamed protein product, partial [Polarella glacialis]
AAPYRGKLSFEGTLLPMLDSHAQLDENGERIEDRLQCRLKEKASSAQLMAKAGSSLGPTGSMFGARPKDLAEEHESAKYQVTASQDHLEQIQNVIARMRRTGRDASDDRDVSDSMMKVMNYQKKHRTKKSGDIDW